MREFHKLFVIIYTEILLKTYA